MKKEYIVAIVAALIVVTVPTGAFVFVESQREKTEQKKLELEHDKLTSKQSALNSCITNVERTYQEDWDKTSEDYPELRGSLPEDVGKRLDNWMRDEKENCAKYYR